MSELAFLMIIYIHYYDNPDNPDNPMCIYILVGIDASGLERGYMTGRITLKYNLNNPNNPYKPNI